MRYRMGQVRALFGERLDDPDAVRALMVALANDPPPSTPLADGRRRGGRARVQDGRDEVRVAVTGPPPAGAPSVASAEAPSVRAVGVLSAAPGRAPSGGVVVGPVLTRTTHAPGTANGSRSVSAVEAPNAPSAPPITPKWTPQTTSGLASATSRNGHDVKCTTAARRPGGDASSLIRAAAAGRALSALFATHLAKENDQVLPLLVAAPTASLADALSGMHELLGAGDHATRSPTSGTTGPSIDDSAVGQSTGDSSTAASGDGCGGSCGCGGDQPAGSTAAPALTIDTRLDVRDVPHGQRHALVLSTVAALPPGDAVVLIASHAPRPVLAEIDGQYGPQVRAQWLQSGPEVWQVRLERVATSA